MVNIFVILIIVLSVITLSSCSKTDTTINANAKYDLKINEINSFEKEAVEGNKDAAFQLYKYYSFVDINMQKSFKWLAVAAKNGHKIAEYNLGKTYLNEKEYFNYDKGVFWMKKSAQHGYTSAIIYLKDVQRHPVGN